MDLNTCYQKAGSVEGVRGVGETVLVPVGRMIGDIASVHVLNEVAAQVWELMDGTRSLDEIVNAVLQEFDVERHDAESDVLALALELERMGCIVPAESQDGNPRKYY